MGKSHEEQTGQGNMIHLRVRDKRIRQENAITILTLAIVLFLLILLMEFQTLQWLKNRNTEPEWFSQKVEYAVDFTSGG